jgi:hypothetical protein
VQSIQIKFTYASKKRYHFVKYHHQMTTQLTEADKESLHQTFNSIATFDADAFERMIKHWSAVRYKHKITLTFVGDIRERP